jgi:hypothetical protein
MADATTPPGTLPVQLTSFVGRRAELAAVAALLGGRRLVTLTGVGGSGKTRLAARLAADQADRWADGVWWVGLEAVTDPAQVAEVAAATIGALVEPVQGPLRSLTVQLRDRRTLVCLDNYEQVVEGAAEVAQALLRSGAGVTVLTTSREPLGVAGETVWQMPPLSEDDALDLFLERASLVRPGFTLDAPGEDAVRTMCRRLDGIPLAWSWPPPGCGRSPRGRSRPGSTTGSPCWSGVLAVPSPASRPWRRRSSGATRCWTSAPGSSSAGSPCSPAGSAWRRRGRSPPAAPSPVTTC